MRIVSWNVHRCIGTDGHYRPDRVAEVLRSLSADVIALQEIDSSLRAEGEIDQLSYLARALGMHSVMGPTLTREYGAYGNALLTNFEILGYQEFDLSYRRFEPRGALSVRLRARGAELQVVNTHLGLKHWERSFQVDRLLREILEGIDGLTIVIGDFNEWFPLSPNNLRLHRRFHSRCPRVPTFPSAWPRFALDRIFFSKPVAGLAFEVPRTGAVRVASDHLPIAAEFAFPCAIEKVPARAVQIPP